ncbi:cell division protein FtsL [secondary endosymbiont of Heteropsylla cubana]
MILEKNSLADHDQIARLAIEKIQMQHVVPLQEQMIFYRYSTTWIDEDR